MNSNLFLFLISLFFARPRLGLNYEAVLRKVVLLEGYFQPDEQFEVGKAIGWCEYSPGDQETSEKRSAFILPTTFATNPVQTGQPHLKYTALAVMEKKFDWKILTRLDSRLRSPCKRATVVRQQRNQQPVQWLPSYNKFLKGKYSKEKKTEKISWMKSNETSRPVHAIQSNRSTTLKLNSLRQKPEHFAFNLNRIEIYKIT